jgi:hypothetical protein
MAGQKVVELNDPGNGISMQDIEDKTLTKWTIIKIRDHELNLSELVLRNREHAAALADFLVYLGEGETPPLEDTITHMWRLAEDCHGDMAALYAALK